MTDFPTYSRAAQKGDQGLRRVDEILSGEYGWVFKRTHQEHDFGIDAHADVVDGGSKVTGQIVAFQIKHGKTFFQEKNRWGYIYRGEQKHFNYLANYPIPVLIVICDDTSGDCHWVEFSPEATSSTGKGWKITIPFGNVLQGQKPRILELLPAVVDAKTAMEHFWEMNDLVVGSDYIHFIIDRAEVAGLDTTRPRVFFKRLRASKELAAHCQGKVELSFYGYDTDPRELFQIAEVQCYVEALFPGLPEALFFLRTSDQSTGLKTLALCLSDTQIIESFVPPHGKHRVQYDNEQFVKKFLMPGFDGLNAITHWLGYTEAENKVICDQVMLLFGVVVPADEA